MALTKEQKLERMRMISTATDDDAAPRPRISAAYELLEKFGRKARHLRIARGVVFRFKKYTSASLGTQRAVRTEADKLSGLIQRLEARAVESEDDEDESQVTLSPESTSSVPAEPPIPGIELLPPDGPDGFWDGIVAGKKRRDVLGISLGLPAFLPFKRADILAKFAPIEKIVPGRDNPPYDESWLVKIIRAGEVQRDKQEIWI